MTCKLFPEINNFCINNFYSILIKNKEFINDFVMNIHNKRLYKYNLEFLCNIKNNKIKMNKIEGNISNSDYVNENGFYMSSRQTCFARKKKEK